MISILFEVLQHIPEALHIFSHLTVLRISHKNKAINTSEHQFSGGIIEDLSWNGVELKSSDKVRDHLGGLYRQKIEE